MTDFINGNPGEMLAFSHALSSWCELTRDGLIRLRGQLHDMRSSGDWDDRNYERFAEKFELAATSLLNHLTDLDDGLAPDLRTLAERYSDLLNVTL